MSSNSLFPPINTTTLCSFAGACLLASCASIPDATPVLAVRLLAPLEFTAFTVRTNLNSTAATTLMREKVKVGSDEPDAYEFLRLPVESTANRNANQPPVLPVSGKRIRVETVEQYVEALKHGASPLTTFNMAMDSWFRSTAATLLFLQQATPSRRSLLSSKLLEQLPVSLLGYHDSDQEQELKQAAARGKILRDYQPEGILRKFESTPTTLRFESTLKTYHLTELARGDYNEDGKEDSLVQVIWHYIEGSGGGVELLLVEGHPTQPLKATPFPLL